MNKSWEAMKSSLWILALGALVFGSSALAQPGGGNGKSVIELAASSPHASFEDIKDGTNNTALAGMVSEARSVPWTKPDDLVFDDSFQTKDNTFVEGAVMFANGSVRYLHLQEGLDRKMYRALFTISGGEPDPLTKLYPPNHTFIQPTYATVQEQVRHSEAGSQNKNSLREINLAFQNYQQAAKHLPSAVIYGPDGKPWHSWRVAILPYLGQAALYKEYDGTVPWDHPKNAAVLNKMPAVYRDPLSDKPDSNKTRYLLVTGAGTAFPTKPTGNDSAVKPAVVTQSPVPNKDWKGWPKDAPPPAIAPFDAAQAKQHQEAWAKHLGVPVEYTNSIGMKFRLIPPGEFIMGNTADEIAAGLKVIDSYWGQFLPSSGPTHKVVLTQPFYLGVYETTQEPYAQVMGHNPAHFAPTGPGRDVVAGKETGKFPVERVSWNDAVDFCARLSAREKLQPNYSRIGEVVTLRAGNGYRLPTEAEWEFACRAGTTSTFWNGNSVAEYPLIGRHYPDKARGRTHAVGELKSNPFGLFDVYGNLWEYAQDNWSASTYSQLAKDVAIDPICLPSGNSLRAMRGGSWMDVPPTSTSGTRLGHGPTNRDYINVGFRVALSVEAVKAALANPVKAEAEPANNNAKEPLTLKGHTRVVTNVAFSPDGGRLASSSIDQSVKLWDVTSGQELLTLSGWGTRNINGKWLTGEDFAIRVWSLTPSTNP